MGTKWDFDIKLMIKGKLNENVTDDQSSNKNKNRGLSISIYSFFLVLK